MDKHQRTIMFSTGTSEYETPQWLFDELDSVFNFGLDPCASDLSHMVDFYFTKEEDGLRQEWFEHNIYINPPYSDCDIWTEAAKDHYLDCGSDAVVLIPARTDTRYWHNHIWDGAQFVLFIKGRLKFVNRMHPSYRFTEDWIKQLSKRAYRNGNPYPHEDWLDRYQGRYENAVGREWGHPPTEEEIIDATNYYRESMDINGAVERVIRISSAPFPSAVVMYTDKFLGSEFDHIGKLVELI